jgi:hypothetical protein
VQKRLLYFLSLISISLSLHAQEVKKADTLNYFIADHSLFSAFDSVIFSNLDGFQFYRPFGKRRLPIAENGNLGLPVHSLLSQTQRWSVNHLIGAYQPYILSSDSMKFYKASNPITIFNYANGAEREQYFTAFHSQNIGEGLNIGFRYDKINSEGFFVRQQTNHSRFHSTYNLESRNKRFKSRGFYTINTIEAFENGGVFLSDEVGGESTAILLDINMFNAQNRSRSREVESLNSYGLKQNKKGENTISIFHKINWTKVSRNFENLTESSNEYYKNFYIDTSATFDTMSVLQFTNQFGIGLLDRFHLFYEFIDYNYFQNFLIDEDLFTSNIGFSFVDSIYNYRLESNLLKGIDGYYKDNFSASIALSSTEYLGLKYRVEIGFNQAVPDYFLTKQRANNYFYNRKFENSNSFRFLLELEKIEWNSALAISFENYSNYIYFDSLVLPAQLEEDIQVIKVEAKKNFSFWRNMHSINRVVFQQITNEEVIPLPNWIAYHSFYYENKLFKNSLKVQIGFDYSWTTSYHGFAYDPAMAQYHLRNNPTLLSGVNQLDFFLNLKIATSARLFFKYENLLYPSYDAKSIRIENYPVPGRVIKVGLSWRMIN